MNVIWDLIKTIIIIIIINNNYYLWKYKTFYPATLIVMKNNSENYCVYRPVVDEDMLL